MASQQSQDRHGCHCGKSFLRKEHLRRHQATHDGPAYSCQVCGRSFSRSDLLRRHAGIHGGAAAVPDSRRGKACDTCHANKTKCDGGLQCSLCSKRGVACTYGRRDTASDPVPSRFPATGSDESPAPRPDSPPEHPVVVALSSSATTWAALRSVLAAVATRSCVASSPGAVPKAWLAACVDSYLATIHQRWPLLHGPGVDGTTDDVALVASMVMMTAWLHCDRSFRQLLMEMHGLLVDQCFKQLAGDILDQSRRWPIETYQVALLNVIFALESGRAVCINRCRHLLSLLVASLRANGCLNDEAVQRQRRTHYPGEFVPWVYSMVERWRRLAACAFQVDTYLSLLCNQPPLLRREELALGLPSTFSMWNAYGLDVFFPRHRDEPWRRASFTMSNLDMTTPHLLPSAVLVEDIESCLLASWNDIWLLHQLRRNRHGTAGSRAAVVARQLRLCKLQLDSVAEAAERPDDNDAYADFLLRAYSAKELPSQPGWRESVRARIAARILGARMLYHLLSLHCHADVQALRGDDTSSSAAEWALSVDGRAALLQAVLVWRTYSESPSVDHPPVVYMALSAAAIILSSACTLQACVCSSSTSSSSRPTTRTPTTTTTTTVTTTATPSSDTARPDVAVGPLTAVESAPDLDEWLTHGSGGGLSLHGLAVCRCNAATWLTRFAEALARGGERWELASIAASNCLSRLGYV
ncbi:hypothetical protein CP533_6437 [Ophiocordyceps camponoti-saundersi (nom. inval.)]|nr:hypothetical protein CP533_6437 [Ophiocordyceps camponoti-saundersi (nom. inval.)]